MEVSLSSALACCALAALGYVAYCVVFQSLLNRWRFRHIPGPVPRILVGTLDVSRRTTVADLYLELSKTYGGVCMAWIGSKPVVVVNDPDAIREVCVRKFKQFHDRPEMPIAGIGKRAAADRKSMLAAKGSMWVTLRAASMPVFHTTSLSQYAQFMNEAAGVLNKSLAGLASTGETFSLDEVLGRLTMRVVFKCAFGVDAPVQEEGASHPVVEAAKQLFIITPRATVWMLLTILSPRFMRPVMQRLGYYFGDQARMERARDVLYAATNQLAVQFCATHSLPPFKADRELLGRGEHLRPMPDDAVPSDTSLLAAFLRARTKDTKEPLETDAVLQQGILFIAAGYETTSMAIAFTAYLLARNPDAEAKLLAEIDAQGRDAVPTWETLEKWPYAQACMKESMRRYPPAPLIIRECLEATTVAGYPIPKGTTIHINTLGAHYDPKYFPEPEAYKPERFLGDGAASCDATYFPFGVGPHACPAYRFAMEEAVIVLIRLYQQFVIRLDESMHPGGKIELKMGLTVSPKNGLWVKAVAR